MEYIASNVAKSAVLVTKDRVWKATICLNCGHIQEALKIFRRIVEAKDLPKHEARSSEYQSNVDGPNYHMDENPKYFNHLTPENEKNQAAI